jgi:hypothetical protein
MEGIMKKSIFSEGNGFLSLLRVVVFGCFVLTVVTTIAGLFFVDKIITRKLPEFIPLVIALFSKASIEFSGGIIGKIIQKKLEVKNKEGVS